MKTFWDKYYQKPIDEIPWQNSPADWFIKLVNNGTITGGLALDLGCGTGKKSIYLAQHGGFKKVIGVDISKQAIKYAKLNAQNNKVENICTFINYDLNDWSFLPDDETFDFILDWAAIHCFPLDKLEAYANNINQHCKSGGKLLIRSFTSNDPEKKYFEEEIGGIKAKISLLTEKDFKKNFPRFRILLLNTSESFSKAKVEAGYSHIEVLMQKK